MILGQDAHTYCHEAGGAAVLGSIVPQPIENANDGSLPLSADELAPLDLLLAAVHTRLKLPREEQTQRYLRALDHPRVAILAHPTARRLGRRGRVDADWDAIFAKAAARGVAVEANGSPERLDLDGGLLRRARALGCRVVVSTDAHSVRELETLVSALDRMRRDLTTYRDRLVVTERHAAWGQMARKVAHEVGRTAGAFEQHRRRSVGRHA